MPRLDGGSVEKEAQERLTELCDVYKDTHCLN